MLLQVKNLRASFSGFVALDDVSLEMDAGELVGLIGTNGAGKSTLFSAMTGYLGSDSGTVMYDGRDLTNLPPHLRVRRGLARTFQVPREFHQLTVIDNLLCGAPNQTGEKLLSLAFRRRKVQEEEQMLHERAKEIASFLKLNRVLDVKAGALSGGQKKLLELGRLLMLQPKCILLDEPFAGVNPVLIGEVCERISELNKRGIAFLIIEHNLSELSQLVQRMYAMDRGKVIAEGTSRKILEDSAVLEAYMGGVL